MIITLAVNVVAQGLMVAYSGGFSPRDSATPAMRWLGSGNIGMVPVAVVVWAVVGVLAVLLLKFTVFGRSIYGIGNKEAAAYLSGIPTQRVVTLTFVLAGGLSAFAGVMLAGYSGKAAQSMGDPYLLSAIAAVVLGGTSILGGRGKYVGTIAGVIFITLLQSILGTLQFGEYFRQVAYGVVIVAMLLLYGRDKVVR
jgi:ribose transport system permease protein